VRWRRVRWRKNRSAMRNLIAGRERGSATVEFAMVLPGIAVLLASLGVAAQLGIAAIRAQDAASMAARIAITDGDAEARAAAWRVAGTDADVRIAHDGAWIRVTVEDSAPWGLVARGSAVARAQD